MADRVTVVVPAAGEGRRMRQPGEPSKQFRELGGAPLLVQTLRALERSETVSAIVVAGPEDGLSALSDHLAAFGLRKVHAVVAGGATRQDSVGRALAAAPAGTDLVLVHDAVRPFISRARLAAVAAAAAEHGAAALAVPVADTLRSVRDGLFAEEVDREGLWRMQTPQAARLALLREAHERFGDLPGTDEVFLLRQAGARVALVRGEAINFKITTPADWELALAVWPAWEEREMRLAD
jgi:2-C-methyl-D-erythritol 4-phosphate cytidylyltransferase